LGKSTIFYQQRTLGNKCWRKRNLNVNQPLPMMPTLPITKEGEEKVTLQFEKEN
jgi:hypothetical protein